MLKKLFLLLLFALSLHAETAASFTYTFETYYDVDEKYTIETIKDANFTKSSLVHINNRRTKPHWFKVVFEDTSGLSEDIIISNEKSYFDTFNYYDEGSVIDVSIYAPYKERAFKTNTPAYKFELKPYEKKTIYIKVQSDLYFSSRFSISNADGFRQAQEFQNFLYMFYLGTCFAISLYFLVLFLYNRDRLYLYYFFYTILLAQITLVYSALYVFLDTRWIHIGVPLMPFTYMFLLLITRKMLENEKKFPYFNLIFNFFMVTFILASVVMIFDQSIGSIIYNIVMLLFFILAVALLIASSKENRIYFSAVFIYLVSVMSLPLINFELVDYNFFTKNLMLIGSFIELILFAAVLAIKVQKLDLDKIQAQHVLLELKEQQNTLLSQKVQEQTKTLNLLLKELQHRVKNNFQFITSFIWAQKQMSNSQEVSDSLDQIRERVFAITSLHEMLNTDEFHQLNLQAYILKIIEAFRHTHTDIAFEHEICSINVDYDSCIALGLILNELLTNSAKYAFKDTAHPKVDVKMFEKDGNCCFIYSDNGVGLDNSTLTESTGFGYEFISEFARSLNKSVINVEGKEGFKFTLEFSSENFLQGERS